MNVACFLLNYLGDKVIVLIFVLPFLLTLAPPDSARVSLSTTAVPSIVRPSLPSVTGRFTVTDVSTNDKVKTGRQGAERAVRSGRREKEFRVYREYRKLTALTRKASEVKTEKTRVKKHSLDLRKYSYLSKLNLRRASVKLIVKGRHRRNSVAENIPQADAFVNSTLLLNDTLTNFASLSHQPLSLGGYQNNSGDNTDYEATNSSVDAPCMPFLPLNVPSRSSLTEVTPKRSLSSDAPPTEAPPTGCVSEEILPPSHRSVRWPSPSAILFMCMLYSHTLQKVWFVNMLLATRMGCFGLTTTRRIKVEALSSKSKTIVTRGTFELPPNLQY